MPEITFILCTKLPKHTAVLFRRTSLVSPYNTFAESKTYTVLSQWTGEVYVRPPIAQVSQLPIAARLQVGVIASILDSYTT